MPFIEKAIMYMLTSYLEADLITREEAVTVLKDLAQHLQHGISE
jgi:hypothetical protein